GTGQQTGALDLTVDQRACLVEFGDVAYERQQHAQGRARGCVKERAYLVAEQCRPIERDAQRTPAERRVFLALPSRVRQHLVAAEIERAEDDGLVGCCLKYLLVERNLIGQAR